MTETMTSAAGTTAVGRHRQSARNGQAAGLAGLKLAQLQALAGQLGITGGSRMRKGDLVAAISAHQRGSSVADRPVRAAKDVEPPTAEARRPSGHPAPRPVPQAAAQEAATRRGRSARSARPAAVAAAAAPPAATASSSPRETPASRPLPRPPPPRLPADAPLRPPGPVPSPGFRAGHRRRVAPPAAHPQPPRTGRRP